MGRRPGRVESEARKFQDGLEDQVDALITAIGALNEWRWSQFPGLHNFEGKLLHSAALDDSYDDNVSTSQVPRCILLKHHQERKVVVVGAGLSGI